MNDTLKLMLSFALIGLVALKFASWPSEDARSAVVSSPTLAEHADDESKSHGVISPHLTTALSFKVARETDSPTSSEFAALQIPSDMIQRVSSPKEALAKPVHQPLETISLSPLQEATLLSLLNRGSLQELTAIRGLGIVRAQSMINARPFDSIDEIMLVEGIGDSTFQKILSHAQQLVPSSREV